MTNEEKLKAIYQKKIENGLVDVKYDIDWSKNPRRDELITELLAMEEAILGGNFTPINFDDGTFTKENLVDLEREILADSVLRWKAAYEARGNVIRALRNRYDWKDIKTAPKDGTWIDLWLLPENGTQPGLWHYIRWEADAWRHPSVMSFGNTPGCEVAGTPTHWKHMDKGPRKLDDLLI